MIPSFFSAVAKMSLYNTVENEIEEVEFHVYYLLKRGS